MPVLFIFRLKNSLTTDYFASLASLEPLAISRPFNVFHTCQPWEVAYLAFACCAAIKTRSPFFTGGVVLTPVVAAQRWNVGLGAVDGRSVAGRITRIVRTPGTTIAGWHVSVRAVDRRAFQRPTIRLAVLEQKLTFKHSAGIQRLEQEDRTLPDTRRCGTGRSSAGGRQTSRWAVLGADTWPGTAASGRADVGAAAGAAAAAEAVAEAGHGTAGSIDPGRWVSVPPRPSSRWPSWKPLRRPMR